MKRSIMTLLLLFNLPVIAEPTIFDALWNAIRHNPQATLFCALAGCATSAKIAYDYAHKKTLQQRKTAEFFTTHPMIILLGGPITDEQNSLLENFELLAQGNEATPQFLLMRAIQNNNPNFQALVNELDMVDYQFVYPQEQECSFPLVAYSNKFQPRYDPKTLNQMLNKKYNEDRNEASSGKLKEKVKKGTGKVRDKLTN